MRAMKRAGWIVLVVAAAGCRDKPQVAATSASPAGSAKAPAADAAAPRDAGPGATDAAIPLSGDARGEVEAFVTRWLEVQNRGDFAGYQQLYTADFTGVRRSGKQTRRFDRAGWFRDRGRMFKAPMEVAIDRLVAWPRPRGVVVFFTQTFAQGRYRDTGTKMLVLARVGQQLAIRYEEMLSSELLDAARAARVAGPPAAPAGIRFGLGEAASVDGLTLAMVADGALLIARTGEDLGAGDLAIDDTVRDPTSGSIAAAVATRSIEQPPPALAKARGRRVQLFDANLTARCTATIGDRFALVAAGWVDGDIGEPDAAAANVWGQHDYVVTASLDGASCGGTAVYARLADLPPAETATVTEDVEQELGGEAKGRVEAADGGEASVAVAGGDKAAYVGIATHVPDTCETQEAYALELFGATKGGAGWRLAKIDRVSGEDDLRHALDLDGDGDLDAVTARGAVLGDRYAEWRPDLRVYWPPGLGCDGAEE